jgi:hypothetical protein
MVRPSAGFPLRDLPISNPLGSDALPRHRWYCVKEAFSPKLVEQAVNAEELRAGQNLWDPFSGGGTAPLTGALLGLHVHALEINPFLCFLSRTKLVNARGSVFRSAALPVCDALRDQTDSPLEGFSTFTAGNRWNRWLFPNRVLRSFECGMRATSEAPHLVRPLLKLALIGAAMDCCNATRDGKCLRYRKNWCENEANESRLQERFQARADVIASDLSGSPVPSRCATVVEGDARRLLRGMRGKFRLCVTSPPYLNSFDYCDVYRPELFLGGFVKSTKALRRVRLNTVRSHVQANWKPPKKDEFGPLYRECITKIRDRLDDLWDPRLAVMVQAYFEDMETVLRALRHRALKNASVWLVVSTSAYGGVEVPVDLILAEIAERSGWYLREVGVLRHLRSSSQHVRHVEQQHRKAVPLRESVVILDASPACGAKSPSFKTLGAQESSR